MDPGLVYELNINDYLNFLCFLGYNQAQITMFSGTPTITIPELNSSVTLSRKLKNVGPPGTYTASLHVPAGLSIYVQPNMLKFDNIGEEKSFNLTIKANVTGVDTLFGEITWSDGTHYVSSPIVAGGDIFFDD
jgi:hypothetical protein